MLVVDRGSRTGRHGVARIELVVELLEADLPPLRVAHPVQFGRHDGVVFPPARALEELASIRGGGPLEGGDELSNEVSVEGHRSLC